MDQFCRICARSDSDRMFPISTESQITQETIEDMLIYCTQQEVSSIDGLPQQICAACMNVLNAAFVFRKLCSKSIATFNELQQRSKTVKHQNPTTSKPPAATELVVMLEKGPYTLIKNEVIDQEELNEPDMEFEDSYFDEDQTADDNIAQLHNSSKTSQKRAYICKSITECTFVTTSHLKMDEHVVKKGHPTFETDPLVESGCSAPKSYVCKYRAPCEYSTAKKSNFERHQRKYNHFDFVKLGDDSKQSKKHTKQVKSNECDFQPSRPTFKEPAENVETKVQLFGLLASIGDSEDPMPNHIENAADTMEQSAHSSRTVHQSTSNIYECRHVIYCDFETDNLVSFEQHKELKKHPLYATEEHTNLSSNAESPQSFACKGYSFCEYQTTHRYNFARHQTRWKHNGVKRLEKQPKRMRYICQECEFQHNEWTLFKKHQLEFSHSQFASNVESSVCSENLNLSERVDNEKCNSIEIKKEHIESNPGRSMRSAKRPRAFERYRCPRCAFRCAKLPNLRTHIVKHGVGNRFRCRICNGSYGTQQELLQHKRRTHDFEQAL